MLVGLTTDGKPNPTVHRTLTGPSLDSGAAHLHLHPSLQERASGNKHRNQEQGEAGIPPLERRLTPRRPAGPPLASPTSPTHRRRHRSSGDRIPGPRFWDFTMLGRDAAHHQQNPTLQERAFSINTENIATAVDDWQSSIPSDAQRRGESRMTKLDTN